MAVSTTCSKISSLGSVWVCARPKARLKISASVGVVLERHADPRERARPAAVSAQLSFTLGWGSHAGDGRTNGLIVTHTSSTRRGDRSMPYRPPATSQLTGIGPTRRRARRPRVHPFADLVQHQLAIQAPR